jgi:hypothetical protein
MSTLYIFADNLCSAWVKWLLLNAMWAIFKIYHGDDDVLFVLDQQLDFHSAHSLKQQFLGSQGDLSPYEMWSHQTSMQSKAVLYFHFDNFIFESKVDRENAIRRAIYPAAVECPDCTSLHTDNYLKSDTRQSHLWCNG